jgi:crossover junction endodeoxyribonuclease RuvC
MNAIPGIEHVFIGIDPGAAGAVAFLDRSSAVLLVEDCPPGEVMMAEVVNKFFKNMTVHHCNAAIEYASSMPGQGVASVFKFGANYGIWRGILAAFAIPFEIVHPLKWKRDLVKNRQDAGKKKAAEVAAALRLWPSMAPGLVGPRGGTKDGRAEALMIAEYCRRKTLGIR